MVQPHDAWPARRPQRREERHAVPDLDERVARAVPTHHLAERGAREDQVAAGLADHAVAVAPGAPARCPAAYEVRIVTSMPASAHSDATCDGVQLGAARLGIVEVAPREDRDPAQARRRRDVAELRDVVGVGRRHGTDSDTTMGLRAAQTGGTPTL